MTNMDIKNKKKITLVLSGGGAKAAAFHIGVCLALQEKGFQFAGGTKDLVAQRFDNDQAKVIRSYVGSSAGAFIAAVLASGYSIESIINAFQVGSGEKPSYNRRDLDSLKPFEYRSIFSLNSHGLLQLLPETILKRSLITGGLEAMLKNGLKLNGLFSTAGIEKYLRQEVLLYNDFSRLGVDLYIIATQLNHSRKAIFGPFADSNKTSTTKYINYASISEAVACSMSLPPVYSPYKIQKPDGKELYFYDGEIRETLSTHVAADHDADLVISSYSVQPYHFTEEMGSLHKYGIPVILNQALYQVIEQKISKHIQYQTDLKEVFVSIETFFNSHGLPAEARDELLAQMSKKLNFNPNVEYIYIHPSPKNFEMFFVDHFSLNPKILGNIIRIGFKSALTTLKNYNL